LLEILNFKTNLGIEKEKNLFYVSKWKIQQTWEYKVIAVFLICSIKRKCLKILIGMSKVLEVDLWNKSCFRLWIRKKFFKKMQMNKQHFMNIEWVNHIRTLVVFVVFILVFETQVWTGHCGNAAIAARRYLVHARFFL
jgi:hypothetical protein